MLDKSALYTVATSATVLTSLEHMRYHVCIFIAVLQFRSVECREHSQDAAFLPA